MKTYAYSTKNIVLTHYSKSLVARAMYEKGKAFLGASILVREHACNESARLHLLCQSIELILKGLLMHINYNQYKPKLRDLGHDLCKISASLQQAAGNRPINEATQIELGELNKLYKKHFLRYGTLLDVLIDFNTVPSSHVLWKLTVIVKYVDSKKLFLEDS